MGLRPLSTFCVVHAITTRQPRVRHDRRISRFELNRPVGGAIHVLEPVFPFPGAAELVSVGGGGDLCRGDA